MNNFSLKQVFSLIYLEIKVAYLPVMITALLQFSGLLLVILTGTSEKMHGIFFILTFLAGMFFYDRPQWDYRMRLLPVSNSERQVSRFLLRALLFGWPFIVSIPVFALFLPCLYLEAFVKFIVPGIAVSAYLSAHLILFYDVAALWANKVVGRFMFLFIAVAPLALCWLIPLLFDFLREKIVSWYISVPDSWEFFSMCLTAILIAGLMMLVGGLIQESRMWASGTRKLSEEVALK